MDSIDFHRVFSYNISINCLVIGIVQNRSLGFQQKKEINSGSKQLFKNIFQYELMKLSIPIQIHTQF